MWRHQVRARNGDQVWIEELDESEVSQFITPMLQAVFDLTRSSFSFAEIMPGLLRHQQWIGAPIPCCFREDLDCDDGDEALPDGQTKDVDYASILRAAIARHGGQWLYAISVEKFVGFVNQGFNYPMNEAVAFRWSAPTDLAPRSYEIGPRADFFQFGLGVFMDDTCQWAMIEDYGRQSVLVGAPEFMSTVFDGIPGGEAGLRRRGNDWQRYYADIKNPDAADMRAAYEALNIEPIDPPPEATPHQRAAILWPFEVIDDPITFR